MEKKTIYALGVMLVLGVLVFVTQRGPEKGDRVGEKPRPVPALKADQIASIEVAQGGGKEKATLTKKGDKWQVTAPYDKPADQQAVKSMTEALEKVKWGDVTTKKKESHGDLEVSEDKGLHVVAKDAGGKALADLYIGKAAGSATMVRVSGQDDVYQVSDLAPYPFKREAKDWRDKIIFEYKGDDAEKVQLIGGGAQVTLEKLPAEKDKDGKPKSTSIYDAKWKIADSSEPGAIKPGATTVDDALVNRLVSSLSNLRANDWQDDTKPETVGLGEKDAQVLVARVTFAGGKTAGVRIGQQKGEDYYAQAEGSPAVFQVKKFSLESVAHLPQDIKDKTVVKLREDELAEVTVQQGADVLLLKKVDKAWKADKVDNTDETKAKPIAESFDNLVGTGFVAPGSQAAKDLVAKPKATVTLKSKSGTAVVLKIGEFVGDDVPVQKAGMDPVWLKKYTVERFLKKPADVKKS